MTDMTPLMALSQWLAQQHRAGQDIPALLQSSMHAGWDADSAVTAVEMALGIKLAPASRIPAPLFRNKTSLDVGDRQVKVVLSMAHPNILVVDNMLSDEECAALIEEARGRLARSVIYNVQTGELGQGQERTSQSAGFGLRESPLISRIEQRLEKFLAWPIDWGEGLQVQRYGIGNQYLPHHDYFAPSTSEKYVLTSQRVATVLLYLNEPDEGGGTAFTDVQLEIAPRRGTAVFFAYDRPYPTTKTRHAGCPVLSGEKWVATKWLRNGAIAAPAAAAAVL